MARRLRDQSRAALPGEIGPEPLGSHASPVLQLWKRHEMKEDPNQPGDKPTHPKAPALQYREILADDRHIALIKVSEWTFWFSSLDLLRDQASNIAALLDRRLRHARHWLAVADDRCRIADDEDVGDIWNVHEGADQYSARPICLGTKQLHDW